MAITDSMACDIGTATKATWAQSRAEWESEGLRNDCTVHKSVCRAPAESPDLKRTGDIKAILEEYVEQPTWRTGKHLVLHIKGSSATCPDADGNMAPADPGAKEPLYT